MKGLLLKDGYMALKYCRAFLLVVLVFTAFSFFGNDNFFFILYPTILVGLVPVTLMSYEHQSRWDIYSAAFPYTRSQLVSVKYLVALIGIGGCLLLTAVIRFFKMLQTGSIEWEGYFTLLGMLFIAGLLTPSLILPFVFKFGVEKGRIAFYIMIALVCALTAALSTIAQNTEVSLPSGWGIAAVCIAGGLLLFPLSWLLSIAFYKKREF